MSMDSLVAERVLGAVPCETAIDALDRPRPCWKFPGDKHVPDWLQPYSTDIGACFAEVVPAMWEWELDLNFWYPAGLKDAPVATAVFSQGWTDAAPRFEGLAFSIPEAICLAALRAVGVSEEELR